MKDHHLLAPRNKTWTGLLILVILAIITGLFVNRFQKHPLGVRYAPKQERIDAAAARVARATQASAGPSAHLNAFTELRPENAYNRALEVWQWSESADLQRSVITLAKQKVTTTEESQNLELMLKALEDPKAQWQECERLSRGNSLEKLIASRRVAVLEKNPQVNGAKNADPAQISFATADHPQEIKWPEFRGLAESKKGVIVDARSEKLYRLGHVPGALNVSREGFEGDYAKQRHLLELDKNRAVAVYCNGLDCEDSKMVSGALIKLGFRTVLIFKGGWQEWTFQHLPEER